MSNKGGDGGYSYTGRTGHDRLWAWFGLDRPTWLTMPRVLMHAMPDDWQARMATLLEEYDAKWDTSHMPVPYVSARGQGNRWVKWPNWVLNYRHPEHSALLKIIKRK